MSKLGERKPDARREKLSIPVTATTYETLQQLASIRGETLTTVARELIEQGLQTWGQQRESAHV